MGAVCWGEGGWAWVWVGAGVGRGCGGGLYALGEGCGYENVAGALVGLRIRGPGVGVRRYGFGENAAGDLRVC
jgi:hypothetical protein